MDFTLFLLQFSADFDASRTKKDNYDIIQNINNNCEQQS